MNSYNYLGKLFKLNLLIERNYLGKTKFEDNSIESNFQDFTCKNNKLYRISIDIFLILGYTSYCIFLFFAFYRTIFLIICSCFLFVSIILMTISHISNNINLIKYLDFIQIFLSSINLIIKGVIISVYFNTDKDDNHQELTRIIIYNTITYFFYYGK